MSDDVSSDEAAAWHRQVAVQQFNATWDLIDNVDRSADDDVEMLLAAATSRWHWAKVGTAENVAAGDWQVAHVAALLGYGELSVTFATRNLAAAMEHGWSGWQLASAHEGVARAWAAAGDPAKRDEHIAAANVALEGEDDPDNAQVVIDQLASIPR
jgi:hypothetical protein